MYLKWLGRENLFLMSARLSPKSGASTVSTTALKPARSARETKFMVTLRSLYIYNWNHFIAFGAASATSSMLLVDIVESM